MSFFAFHRYLAHNGEINTLRGNVNLMNAREGVMSSETFGEKLRNLYPVVEEGMSDSGSVDNVLEFLCQAGGRSLPEVSGSQLHSKGILVRVVRRRAGVVDGVKGQGEELRGGVGGGGLNVSPTRKIN